MNGVKAFIEKLKANDYKIGLATNSPNRIIPVVLRKLDILHLFDAILSAEFEEKGKPAPTIYCKAAERLVITSYSIHYTKLYDIINKKYIF